MAEEDSTILDMVLQTIKILLNAHDFLSGFGIACNLKPLYGRIV